jgi:hypothetical protein
MSQEHQLSYFVSATDKTCSREEVTTAQQPMTLGRIRSEIYTFAQVGTSEKKEAISYFEGESWAKHDVYRL